MTHRRRVVSLLARVERRLTLRRVLIAAAVFGATALVVLTVTVLAALALGLTSALVRLALAVTVLLLVATSSAVLLAIALGLRLSARTALDVKALRIECRQQSGRAEAGALTERITSHERDILGVLGTLGTAVKEHASRQMTASEVLLEHVLRTQGEAVRVRAVAEDLVQRTAVAERAAAERARQRRVDLQALLSLHSTLQPRRPLPLLGDWAVAPDAARRLVGLVLERRPEVLLELGSGSSTVLCAAAMEIIGTGRLVSLEHDEHFAMVTRRELARHGLAHRATVVTAPLVQQAVSGTTYGWYDLTALDLDVPADLLFVDGPPASTGPDARYPALPLLRDRLSRTALVVLDDADRPNEQDIARRWLEESAGASLSLLPGERGMAVLTLGGGDR